jgi:hypothetical protein
MTQRRVTVMCISLVLTWVFTAAQYTDQPWGRLEGARPFFPTVLPGLTEDASLAFCVFAASRDSDLIMIQVML